MEKYEKQVKITEKLVEKNNHLEKKVILQIKEIVELKKK